MAQTQPNGRVGAVPPTPGGAHNQPTHRNGEWTNGNIIAAIIKTRNTTKNPSDPTEKRVAHAHPFIEPVLAAAPRRSEAEYDGGSDSPP